MLRLALPDGEVMTVALYIGPNGRTLAAQASEDRMFCGTAVRKGEWMTVAGEKMVANVVEPSYFAIHYKQAYPKPVDEDVPLFFLPTPEPQKRA